MITGALGGGGATSGSGGGGAGLGGGALAGLLGQSSLLPANGQLPPGVTLPSSSSSSASAPTTTGIGGALGGMASGLIQSQVDMLVAQLQKGVREVRLTVFWPEGRGEDSLSVATHLVVLNAPGAGTSTGAPPGQGTATGTSGTTAVPGQAGAPSGGPPGGFPGAGGLGAGGLGSPVNPGIH
jgi:hypothetical protein